MTKLIPHPLYPEVRIDETDYIVKVQKVEPAIRLFPVVNGLVGQIPLSWGTKAFEGAINKEIKPIINNKN